MAPTVRREACSKGSFGDLSFAQPVVLAAHARQVVSFDPSSTPVLHVLHPKLWWPNGYGPQNLYMLHLSFEQQGRVSDRQKFIFRRSQDHLLRSQLRKISRSP